jgi:DNA-binding response OmpR family regulator
MPYKLLLADDSLTIQKVVELVLAPEDFEIRAFNDGEQALQALDSFKPDIVLADIEMPKLNGYQLCEKIKNDMATAMIPVILLAGAFEPFDEEYAKSVYADDFIIKPFESQELISKVKALLKSFEPAKQTDAEEIQEEELLSEAGTPEVSVGLSEAMDESVELSKLAVQEPRWDEEIPVAEEKAEEQVMTEEEYEAKGFDAELSKAMAETMKEEKIPAAEETKEALAAPVIERASEIPQGIVEEKISGVIVSDVLPQISSAIKDSVQQAVSSIAPDIIENVTRQLMKDLMGSMRGEIEAAIKKIVPEVAETLIKKEIEKITSELS